MKFEITNKEEFANRPLLPKEIKSQWLDALRSGKFKKGAKFLCVKEKYCCLGVLCEVQKIPFIINSVGKKLYSDSQEGMALMNTNPLYDVLSTLGHFKGFRFRTENYFIDSLAHINDNTKTFKKVISIIEKYF